MTDYNTCLQTVAAISSAIAAFAAAWAAKNTFTFQKNSLLKKATIEQILKLLQQFHHLKSLTGQAVLGVVDKEFTGLKQLISETRESVMTLESMISAPTSAEMARVRNAVHGLREENVFACDDNTPNITLTQQLDDAISALQKIYRTEIK